MQYLVPGIVIVVLFWLWMRLDNRAQSQSRFVDPAEGGDQEFRPATWWLGLLAIGFAFFSTLAVVMYASTPHALWLSVAIFGTNLIATAIGLIGLSKTRLIFRGDSVTYRGLCIDTTFHIVKIQRIRGLMMEMTFQLSEIELAYVNFGNIVIQFKDKSRKVIPNIFGKSGRILAMLFYYRPTN